MGRSQARYMKLTGRPFQIRSTVAIASKIGQLLTADTQLEVAMEEMHEGKIAKHTKGENGTKKDIGRQWVRTRP